MCFNKKSGGHEKRHKYYSTLRTLEESQIRLRIGDFCFPDVARVFA